MDKFTKAERSRIMSRITGRNTKPEEQVRKYLFSKGFRYRKNDRRYPGKPDIVLPKYRTVIFVNGCFWHQHKECGSARLPKTNTDYWARKLSRNVERDNLQISQLRKMGWNVITVCECEISGTAKRAKRLAGLEEEIKQCASLGKPVAPDGKP